MNTDKVKLHLFDAFGVELEYMIVDKETYDATPIADWLLAQVGDKGAREVERGNLCWSNELAMHVIELKGNGPVTDISSLLNAIQENIKQINSILDEQNACLMGGAMHPWMNPDKDTCLWTFEDAPIYEALDKTFGCQGHGWFNLQSAHLNLPFANDDEFTRLHAAIRLVLPIIPSLAAASPFYDGKDSGVGDARLKVYSQHCNRLPEAIGQIIPEPISCMQAYQDVILKPLYAELAKREPEGILQFEWSNARGAIARFDRNAIEIRLIDVQEHPAMDVGILSAVASVIQLLTDQANDDLEDMNAIPSKTLKRILDSAILHGENAYIKEYEYLQLLAGDTSPVTGACLWRRILSRTPNFFGPERMTAEWIIDNGTLATRMRRICGPVSPTSLKKLSQ